MTKKMSCGKYTDILYCGNYIQYIGWFMYCFTKWENFCPVETVQDDSCTAVAIYVGMTLILLNDNCTRGL